MSTVALAFLIAAGLTGGLTWYAVRKRNSSPDAAYFSLVGVCITLWTVAALGDVLSLSPQLRLIWWKVSYFGIAPLPVFWFVFVLNYAGATREPARRLLPYLSALPAVTLALVWTNSFHGLIWSHLDTRPGSAILWEHGWWLSFVHLPYFWGLMVAGEVLLIHQYLRIPRIDRPQCALLAFAGGVPLVVNAASVLEVLPTTSFDPTPIAFTIAALLIGWGLLSFRLFDFTPIAHEVTLRCIGDAVIVVDAESHVRTVNKAASELLGQTEKELLEKPLADLFAWEDVALLDLEENNQGPLAARMQQGKTEHQLEVRLFPIQDWRCVFRGRVLLLRDLARQPSVRRLEQMAYRDYLTGLSNRPAFCEAADRAIAFARRRGLNLACVLLDLDGFKEVNDRFGHSSGDLLLQLVASRLRGEVRAEDTVARLGGDEFAILMADCEPESVSQTAQRIACAVRYQPFEVHDSLVRLDLSVGIAFFPEGGEDVEKLLANADAAMYQAKQKGGELCVYNPADDAHSHELLRLESSLHNNAVQARELIFHYQPLFRIETGSVASVEALVRWKHPENGLMHPAAFLPKLKERGLAREIDRYVLREVLREVKDSPFSVAVNVSSQSVLDPKLPMIVREALEMAGVEPRRLTLEITEEDLSPPESAKPHLQALSDMGVLLAADDFGTGYSSLAYLRHFPLDSLKLDRYLVAGIGVRAEDEAIIRAVLSLANDLELEVVAEGVETEDQLQWLESLGCSLVQGFLIGRPIPLQELMKAQHFHPIQGRRIGAELLH